MKASFQKGQGTRGAILAAARSSVNIDRAIAFEIFSILCSAFNRFAFFSLCRDSPHLYGWHRPAGSRRRASDFLVARQESHQRIAPRFIGLATPGSPPAALAGRPAMQLACGSNSITEHRRTSPPIKDIARRLRRGKGHATHPSGFVGRQGNSNAIALSISSSGQIRVEFEFAPTGTAWGGGHCLSLSFQG